MKRVQLAKAIASLLIAVSALALNPVGASAEWKQDSNGWWNTEGSSWSIGWRYIDGKWYYFDDNGYMKKGWLQYRDKWYYLSTNGTMAKNTTIDGYNIGSDGAWIQAEQSNSSNSGEDKNKKAKTSDYSDVTINQFVSSIKTKVNKVKVVSEEPFSYFLPVAARKVVTIDDEDLNVYIYSSNEEMEKGAASIFSDGNGYTRTWNNSQTTAVNAHWWCNCQHFYKKGNIIVQYGGTKENIFYYLNDFFGEQFAGYTKNVSIKKVNSETKKISDITGINFDDITKIVFYDGRGGRNKPVTVKDKQKIKEFMGYLGGYVITETKNPLRVGWIQSAVFYINEEDVMDITFVDPIVINGNYYKIIQGGLEFKTIGEFIKSIDPAYDIMAGLRMQN